MQNNSHSVTRANTIQTMPRVKNQNPSLQKDARTVSGTAFSMVRTAKHATREDLVTPKRSWALEPALDSSRLKEEQSIESWNDEEV